MLSLSDLAFVTLGSGPFMDSAFPTKLLEPLALRKPVLAALPRGMNDDKLLSTDAIYCVPNDNPDNCAKTILKLVEDPQLCANLASKGWDFVSENFKGTESVEKLWGIINKLLTLKGEKL